MRRAAVPSLLSRRRANFLVPVDMPARFVPQFPLNKHAN